MFSDADVIAKLVELDVEMVVADDTKREPRHAEDIKRCDRSALPVNLIYPSNYPAEPAILLDAAFSPGDALKILARMGHIKNGTVPN